MDRYNTADGCAVCILLVGNPIRKYENERVVSIPTVVTAALLGCDIQHSLEYGTVAHGILEVGAVDLLGLRCYSANLDVGRCGRIRHGL